MSGALSQALETVGRDLERGILDAERELADSREHCRWLETEVRALRAAVRPMPPALTALLSAPDTHHPEAPASKDQQGSVDLTEAAQDPGMIVLPAAPPVEASNPYLVAPTAAESHPGADETSTDYMPMLEELWGIARREASS